MFGQLYPLLGAEYAYLHLQEQAYKLRTASFVELA
jgi:hypothetical protein